MEWMHMPNDFDGSPVRFEDLGLSDTVLDSVRDMGYEEPTPVQAAAIPEVLAGRDLLAAAQTGTGKTAAFLLPALDQLGHVAAERKRGRGRGPLMLVITPTRELAQQIDEVCTTIARRTHHSAVTVVGGVGYNPQRSALKRGCDVLVATPGRLIDLIDQGSCNLSEVRTLVLDEADRMLDMGFLPSVRKIVACTPAERQTLLFSATLDDRALKGITDLVRNPVRVEIAPPASTADTVDQYVLPVSLEAKNGLLAQVLKREGTERAIVFVRTKRRADTCCKRLARREISALAIHGDRSQAQRERALKAFRDGKVDVLVATDVLARGIDITDVRYVVNFDVPSEPTDYIHRIGRTGRAGEAGWSVTFVTEQDVSEFYAIEGLMGKTAQLYDSEGLDLGENPPMVDPEREPGAGRKKKTKRGKSTSRKKRSAAKPADGGSAPRPARPKRAGKARVRVGDDARGERNSGASQAGEHRASARSRRKRSTARMGAQGQAASPTQGRPARNVDRTERSRTRRRPGDCGGNRA